MAFTQADLCQGVTLQCNSLLTMLLHVFASPVYASPVHVTAWDKFHGKTELGLPGNNQHCSRIPRHVQCAVWRGLLRKEEDCQSKVCVVNFHGVKCWSIKVRNMLLGTAYFPYFPTFLSVTEKHFRLSAWSVVAYLRDCCGYLYVMGGFFSLNWGHTSITPSFSSLIIARICLPLI